eukprot:CAMPEP_0116887424 /NCGR_PEP_ID=MMETSP0463-20121206/21903_1 /TAXON_ID=181622 /ORGANISM="Strombidinopsis sp, Strain SopsisLIS2011" /LENGTH=104 /DNA_ID=CAMNT_0004550089 /DNA_START=51 /DNA_END=365 /DNA_ORIENTATION=-
MDQEVLDARAKLAAKFSNASQIGGKGTQRRKKKHVTVQNVNEDKKLTSAIKKFGVQPLQDIEEVNMFKDDNTVIHFRKPLQSKLHKHLKLIANSSILNSYVLRT